MHRPLLDARLSLAADLFRMSLNALVAFAAAACAGGLALTWLVFKHRIATHWSFAIGLLLAAADTALAGVLAGSESAESAFLWQGRRMWLTALLPSVWLVYSLCYSRGNYLEFLDRWRWVLVGAVLIPVSLAAGVRPHLIGEAIEPVWGPVQFIPLSWAGKALEVIHLLGLLVVLINLEKTFRSTVGMMRWRVKFVLLGLAVILGGRMYVSSQAVLFSGIQLSVVGVLGTSLLLGTLLLAFSFLRTGLSEVDVYPSHAFLYGSLTVLLAGVYLLSVGVLAEIVARFGGDQAFALKALLLLLALVGLAVVLMSDRVRHRTQQFISRHLRRPVYDYRRVWAAFTERTTSRLDQADLCRAVATLIAETFNTLSVTVWLVDPHRQQLRFGASTALTEQAANELLDLGDDSAAVIAAVRAAPTPLDLNCSEGGWVETLKRCNPDYFKKGGNRVCVPLVAAGEVLGFITLADRVSGVQFSHEDYDLLKCIGDQVAASLLNLQLSRKLIEARELEAFQSMSAFFVHDLKNTASTLSLMLQNLPVHFNDPRFRADALRGIGASVDRLNGLVQRLALIRRGLEVKPVLADLNQLVTAALGQIEGADSIQVTQELQSIPRLPVDLEQLPKVLTNLLLNAREAISGPGTIRVATMVQGGHAVVSVADTGCGMSPEFLSRRLFRPFQTTKKKGLGIGMFQSKMIVEAHGGRLEVDSQPGRGTTFRVVLPLHA